MQKLLTLKSWQVFFLIWGIPFLTVFIPLEQMRNKVLFGSLMGFFILMLFGWYFILGFALSNRVPKAVSTSKTIFLFHMVYVAILYLFILFIAVYGADWLQGYAGIFILAVFYYFAAVFIILRFISKILASIELDKLALASDYSGYMFLLFFSPIGIWMIQPKIRKIFL